MDDCKYQAFLTLIPQIRYLTEYIDMCVLYANVLVYVSIGMCLYVCDAYSFSCHVYVWYIYR